MQKNEDQKSYNNLVRVYLGGLLALSLVLLPVFFSIGKLSQFALFSAIALAAAIPLLAGCFHMLSTADLNPITPATKQDWACSILLRAAILVDLLSLLCAFLAFIPLAAMAFFGTGLIVSIIYFIYF